MVSIKPVERENTNKATSNKSKIPVTKKSLIFVVHRHEATHLHYDLRLEMGGVLKSWAIPKGPSIDPAEKRLAIRVEDHPYAYKDFEGVITEGYGAGKVEIFDKGKLLPEEIDGRTGEEALLYGLKKGEIIFRLSGKKLKGSFVLIRMKGRDKKSWLLIKRKDEVELRKKNNLMAAMKCGLNIQNEG